MGEFITSIVDALISTLINDSGTDAIAGSLTFTSGVFDLINKIWHYFVIFGIGMTTIYFLIEMNQKLALEGRDMNLKTFFAPFLKLMIAIAVLSQGAKIVSLLLNFHNGFIEYVKDNFFLSTTSTTDTESYVLMKSSFETIEGSLAFFGKVGLIIPLLLMWVVNLVLSLIWQYKAISFKLEYLFKIAITPIALSDVYSGQNATAIRWLKGFLGLSLYGMAFIVVQRIGASMAVTNFTEMSEILTETSGAIGAVWTFLKCLAEIILVVPIAQLGVLSAIRQLTKEALG